MPLTHFYCPDMVKIKVQDCLSWQGCRLKKRCCPIPILRRASWDRTYRGVTWSQAGNDARLIWLKAIEDYAVLPDDRMFSILGIDTHARASQEELIDDVLAEQRVKDRERGQSGILDLLERDEYPVLPGEWYILYDYKTSGSFQLAKWTGRKVLKEDRPVMDEKTGEPYRYKSGKRKGEIKYKQHKSIVIDTKFAYENLRGVMFQLNRYRIEIEKRGFPVSKMIVFSIPRDGGLWIAKARGIMHRSEQVEIPRLEDQKVIDFYDDLQFRVDQAFDAAWAAVCGSWQCWDGDRCANYCEVREPCQDLCMELDEQWPGKGKERKQEVD